MVDPKRNARPRGAWLWRAVAAAMSVFAGAATPSSAADVPVTECDRLAAHPSDPHRVAPGVQNDVMDWRAAILACTEALKLHPEAPRLSYQLGRALIRGQRREEGLQHLLRAAERNYRVAFANLGNLYASDLRNPAEGLKWLRRGIEQDDRVSRLVLGEMYVHGDGVERDLAEALRLLEPLALEGDALAIYKLGAIYVSGDARVARDYAKALQWYQRAAQLGVARAQNDLAYMVEHGLGVAADPKRAAELYRASAQQGWGKAQNNMGRLHESGAGVERSPKEAFYWYRLAADSSLEEDRAKARARLEALRRRVEPSEIAEVDARVNKWRKMAPAETVALLPKTGAPEPAKPASVAAADPAYVPPARTPEPGVDQSYTPPRTFEVEPAKGRYIAKSGNIRSAPDTSAALAGRLTEGQEVNVTGKVVGRPWMVFLQDGAQVFVHAGLLKDAASLQVAAAPPGPAAAPAPAPPAVTTRPDVPAAPAPASAPSITPMATGADYGSYHALVIGNSAYRHIVRLKSPKADSHAIAELLRRDFGFRVTLLLEATRADIIGALAELRATLKWNDNLLIYYAGHGVVDEATERGYWLPVDADEKVPTNWVSNADITDMVRAIEAKHVMVVADACYSGTLMRDTTARIDTARDRQVWLRRITSKRARTVLASGGNEPVLDSGGGEHSVFAKAFLTVLRESDDVIDAVTLYDRLRRPVVLNSDQTPRYADIRNAGHDGGEFVFVRRKPAGN